MPDFLVSLVRTWASDIVGALVGLALAAGIVVPAELSHQATVALAGLLVLLAQMLWYAAVRFLEQRHPGFGRLLLAARPPAYGKDVPVHVRAVVDTEQTEQELARVRAQILNDIDRAQRYRRM